MSAYTGFWWSRAFDDWDAAVQYANRKAQAVGIRQSVKWRKTQRDWVVLAA
jgi:hypothetical protein